MVIRGNSRGNGRQLADYLVTQKDNDRIWILEVNSQDNGDKEDLRNALFDMDVTAELTRGRKGLYHAQINPDEKDSQKMSDKDWERAADILGHHLGYDGQRRVIVMHEKKGRIHAHVVWERYDHTTGLLKPDSFNYVAQDKARQEMEQLFGHKVTPKRNKQRPELKKALTDIWNKTTSGKDFTQAVHQRGFILAQGTPRHPFMVVDKEARSFDMVRQLKGVRIKEVRQRMRGIDLVNEKIAIEQMKKRGESEIETGFVMVNSDKEAVKKEKSNQKSEQNNFTVNQNKPDMKQENNGDKEKKETIAKEFAANRNDIKQDKQKERNNLKSNFEMTKEEITGKREAMLRKIRENSGQISNQPKPEIVKKRNIDYDME